MAIQAQMADGRVLEFPDGTDTAVIQSTVQRLISAAGPDKQPPFGSPMGEDFGSSIMAAAQPKRESVLQGMEMPTPAVAPFVKPQFIDALQANLNALPEAERTAKLERLKQRPDVYGRAANVIAQRYADQDLGVSPTLQKLTDLRLEPQVQRFMEQGMEAEAAKNLAAQQAMIGRARPNLQQMNVDVAGEQAKAEAERIAQEMKDAGFMTRVGTEAKGQATQTGLGLINMYADLTGDKEMQGRIAGATRIQEEAGKAIPKGDSIAERAAQQALASAATQAPMMLLGTLTGTSAPMLVQAGVQSLGSAYGAGRAAGLSPEAAMTRAAAYAAAEITFERFGMTKALGGLKKYMNQTAKDGVEVTGNDIARYFGKAIASEIPSEMATTLTQYGIDIVPGIGLNKNPSVEDLYKQLEETLRQTVIQSGVMAGAGAGVVKGSQAISSRLPERRQSYEQDTSIAGTAEQMARERGFFASEQKVKPPVVPSTLAAPTTGRIEPTFEPDNLGAAPTTNEPTMEREALTQSNSLAQQRAEDQKRVLDLEKELETLTAEDAATLKQNKIKEINAPTQEGAKDVTGPAAGEGVQPDAAAAKEDYANKSLEELENLRSTADQTNDALDIASVKKHFGSDVATAYENMGRRERNRWWNENATEALDRDASTFNGVNEDLLDEYIKAHNNFDTESPNSLGRSVGLLARKIKDPKFVGSPEFVTLKNALAYAKQQGFSEAEVLGGMRERASEWAGADAQELFKDLFKAKPTQVNAPKLEPVAADEEYIPFYGEDLTNKPMPTRLEIQELEQQQEEASKDVEKLSKRTAGTSLFKVLQGSLKNSEMSELGGRSRQVGKNPFMSLVAKKGKPGSSMEDMVDSGTLDLFLPEKMRPESPMYDNQESAAYIRENLIQGQYYTYETQMEIDRVTRGIEDLDKLIQEELSIDDINKEIQLAFDEQREANLDATQTVSEGEAGGVAKGEGAKAESDFLKTQTAEELKAKQDEIDRLTKENERLAKEAERKTKADEEAGDFTLTGSDREADQAAARGQKDIFAEAPAAEPKTVAISPEQERKEALEQLERQLKIIIPPFKAVGVKKTQILRPAPLTNLQIKEILQLASDAIDLGMPAAVLGNVKGAGSTRMKAGGVMSEQGWLMIGSQWKSLSSAAKLHTLVHELGHSVDFKSGTISYTANWSKAETELKNWYTGAANKFNHPFRYPYAPQYKGSVDYEMESFAEAFARYFTSPVDLQKNAPEAYSQIQAIVERIQDGSQKAREAGTTERGTAGIQIRPSRTEKSTAVQPGTRAIGAGVGGTKELKNQGAGKISSEKINASVGKTIFDKRPLVNWTTPDQTGMDQLIKLMQNKHIDTKRVIDAIESTTGQIEDRWNPYLMEENFHGRTAKQTKDFTNHELKPLFNDMREFGVNMDEFEEYLHNRHAQERNEQIAQVNVNMPDKGSGIETADAQKYLTSIPADKLAKYKKLAKMVDSITSNTRQLLVDSGLESEETIQKWEDTYKHYIPLNRDDVDYSSNHGMSVGQGYSVKGTASRRATGSERAVVDILANIAMQRERNIVRAEKNRVATALYGLALKNSNPKFWLAVNPDAKKNIGATVNELVDMGFMPSDVRKLMEEPRKKEIDPRTGLVTEVIHQISRGADNVMALRVNGENRFVFFNQNNDRANSMVRALKNLDADQLGTIMSGMALATRYIASINTQYNPVFGALNFARDVQGAVLQLSTTPIAGEQKAVMLNVLPAMMGIYKDLRLERDGKVGRDQWSRLWEDFQQHGGQTGFRDQFSRAEERGIALQRIIDPTSWSQSKMGKVFSANGTLTVPIEVARKTAAPIFNWLSDYNETMENSVRLAAYKVALDKGFSKDRAASIAKNLTVNFNRKGDIATQAGAMYAFFNASVQGTTRLAQTLAGPAGAAIVGGGLLLGTIEAVLMHMAGFGDDNPADFVKEKNLIIPTFNGGKYIAIPLALGYNVIPNFSRLLTEATFRYLDGKPVKATETTFKVLESLMGAFNPIGNAGWSFQTFAPTVADPFVALGENKDWTGKKIAREDFNSLHPTPGYLRAKESASTFGRVTSKWINSMSGGTEDVKGKFSPTPDQIDYLVGQATGGVGREGMKVERFVRSKITGEELPSHSVPVFGRFYGDTKESSSVANQFYQNLIKMNEYEDTVKGMAQRKENVGQFLKENPEAVLYKMADQVERNVQKLRKLRHNQVEKEASKEVVKGTEKLITNQMTILNDQIEKLEKQRANK